MLHLGQVFRGKLGSYRLTRQLQNTVWLAVNIHAGQKVIVKYAQHFRIKHEGYVLRRFQGRTPYLRPLIDEIQPHKDCTWPALVLRWLDDDALHVSNSRRLSRVELKHVAQGVLRALEVLHGEGYVHTDVKPSNVLVNLSGPNRDIIDVQLADLESTVHRDSSYAIDGDQIGTPIFRSPEAVLQMRWGTPTDIWSFGTMMISLIYGANFHIFQPNVPRDDEDYDIKILMSHNQWFGPFPATYQEIADADRLLALQWVMENSMDKLTPFKNIVRSELSDEDKSFLLRVMKLDPRDRPTVTALLADDWFHST